MVGPLGGGGGGGLENANPLVYRRQSERPTTAREQDEGLPDAIDDREIFDILWRRPGRGGEGGSVGVPGAPSLP